MAFWKRGPGRVEDTDINESRRLRAQAEQQYEELVRQRPHVTQVTSYLVTRRAQNNFGEEVTISFQPRRKNA